VYRKVVNELAHEFVKIPKTIGCIGFILEICTITKTCLIGYTNRNPTTNMKNIEKKYLKSTLLMCLSLVSLSSYAQNIAGLTEFLKAEKNDASALIKSYVTPAVNAISNGMTSGWYTTGKAHKTLGFDLGVSLSAVFTPSSDQYFTPSLSSATKFVNNTNPTLTAPSVVGPADKTTYTSTYDPDGAGPLPSQAFSINGPEGLDLKKNIGFSALPVPMVQLGIGIIKNTDLKIRFVPEQKSNSVTFKMFGIGVMHDIKQHIPGIKKLPFDLSVLAAYNSITGTASLVSTSGVTSSNGILAYKLNSWVAQAIISKKISVLTGYLGVGYGSVSSNVDITGNFLVPAGAASFALKDPLALSLSSSSAKLTAGIRLKFGPVYLSGDYTLQKYDALTVGFGFAVR
jgi:hypothetical protein